jgi:hypothetical protein
VHRIWSSFGLAFTLACAKQLPPPKTPEQVAPVIKIPGPPASGMGRVVIDIVDGPAIVEEVISQTVVNKQQGNGQSFTTMQYNGRPIKRKLCVSPCVLDLPLGTHNLSFTTSGSNAKTDETTIIFSEAPMVYRRALGNNERKPLWFGGIGAIGAGAILLGVGALKGFGDGNSSDNVSAGGLTSARVQGANIGLMVGGGVLMGVGGLLMKQNQPIKQSGAETFWALAEPVKEPIATKPPPLQDPGFKDPKTTPENSQERAAKLYEEAKAHYNLQEYETALNGFKEAYLLSKEAGLLFNIGQCYRQMGKDQEAIRSFKAYLNEDPESPQRVQIEQWLKEMGAK